VTEERDKAIAYFANPEVHYKIIWGSVRSAMDVHPELFTSMSYDTCTLITKRIIGSMMAKYREEFGLKPTGHGNARGKTSVALERRRKRRRVVQEWYKEGLLEPEEATFEGLFE